MKARDALFLLFLLQPAILPAEEANFTLLGIEDGDTLIISIDNQSEKIQLLGIDAPEDVDNAKLKHDVQRTGAEAGELLVLGNQATQFLKTLLPVNTAVKMDNVLQPRDRYGRIPADVRLADGQSIRDLMLSEGYAIVLRRPPLDDALKGQLMPLEQNAIEQKRGLWGSQPQLMRAWSGLETR
ncbi:MAG: hypothetical protein C0631_12125 [Sedimenticola sp.]|mgnify:CR=1 FL=1|jgi:micrococcal nuclease|nr:MAG: hypothetical protein C0631_12125 [Sedimenticola sp.]